MADNLPPINLDDMDFGATIRGHQKGDRVFERFLLQRLLGRGGMGVVWLASDERLKREVALKFAPQLVRFDDLAIEELKEETRKGLDLAHPHIVKIYDFLLDEDNAAISMEFIDGENLGSLRTRQPNKIFEPHQVERWARQMLDALDYAHVYAKVIHRDLKPANLMIDRGGDLRVTDFGIARSISDALSRATMMGGNSTGTLAYMSPQQAEGRKPRVSDDIYAFGSTMYELLTGKPPFFTGNISAQLREEIPATLTDRRAEFNLNDAEPLPQAWEETILACLEKDPERRPPSAAIVRDLLGLSGASTSVPPIPGGSPGTSFPASGLTAQPYTGRPTSPPTGPASTGRPMAMPVTGRATSYGGTSAAPAESTGHATSFSRSTAYVPPTGAPASTAAAATPPISSLPPGLSSAAKIQATDASAEQQSPPGRSLVWLVLGGLAVVMLLATGVSWWVYKNSSFFKVKGTPEVTQNPPPVSTTPSDPNASSGSVNGTGASTSSQDPGTVASNQGTGSTSPSNPGTSSSTGTSPSTGGMNPPSGETPPPSPGSGSSTPAFTTIQAAIDAAKEGDTVIIPADTYEEQVRMKNGVHLKAAETGLVVVKTNGASGPAFQAEGIQTGTVTGFVFQHTGTEVSEDKAWPLVFCKSSSVLFENCIIEKGIGNGALVTGASKPEFRRCQFRRNALNGLVLEAGVNGKAVDCEYFKNGVSGVEIRLIGTQGVIEGGKSHENGDAGIVVKDGAGANISGALVVRANVDAGIAAAGEGTTITVTGVESSANLLGVAVKEGAKGEIKDCLIKDNNRSGMELDMSATGTLASGNKVLDNKGEGLLAASGKGILITITDNTCSGNGANGIIVFGEGFQVAVERNQCLLNTENGILAGEGVIGLIKDNRVGGNHLAGVNRLPNAGADLVVQGTIEGVSGTAAP